MRKTALEENKTEMINRFEAGMTTHTELADAYGVSSKAIQTHLRKWNVDFPTSGRKYDWLDDYIDEIVDRYIIHEDSLQTIANEYGTTTSPIKTRLRDADVELRPVEHSFTDTQRSIIEGELLGDACIYRRHETACHFKLESTTKAHPAHVRTHLPRGVFPNTQPYSLDRQTKWSDATRWIIYSRGQTLFDELQTKWYEGAGDSKRKTVPESFDLDETALLHWYLGDGSLSERANGAYRLHFSTHGFPEASVRRLQTQLDALGYDSYTSHASHVDNGSGLAIYISRESSQALLDRLADRNSISAFDYKFSPTAE